MQVSLILEFFFVLQLSILQKQHFDELNKEVKGEHLTLESNASDKKSVDTGVVEGDLQQADKDAADMLMVGESRKKRGLYKAIEVVFLILYAILISIVM